MMLQMLVRYQGVVSIKGHSFTKKLCLPTGVCEEDADYVWNLGSGIVNLNVAYQWCKSIVVPDR